MTVKEKLLIGMMGLKELSARKEVQVMALMLRKEKAAEEEAKEVIRERLDMGELINKLNLALDDKLCEDNTFMIVKQH